MIVASGLYEWLNYPGFEAWKFINLIIFVGAGVYLLQRPLRNALRDRRESIKRELRRALQERDEALAKLTELETRLTRVDDEIAVIQQKAIDEAAAEAERLRLGTDAEIAKLREVARREIEGAGKAAVQELRAATAQLSVSLAEEMIRREIRIEDDERLIGLSADHLGRSRV